MPPPLFIIYQILHSDANMKWKSGFAKFFLQTRSGITTLPPGCRSASAAKPLAGGLSIKIFIYKKQWIKLMCEFKSPGVRRRCSCGPSASELTGNNSVVSFENRGNRPQVPESFS